MVEFNSIFVKPVAVYLSSFSECFCCDNSCNLFRKIGVIWSKSKSFHRNFIKICTEWWIILPFLLANSEIQSSLGGLTIQSESCQSVRSFVCLWKAKYMMSDSLSCNPHLTTPCVLCEVYGINDMINMNRKFFDFSEIPVSIRKNTLSRIKQTKMSGKSLIYAANKTKGISLRNLPDKK